MHPVLLCSHQGKEREGRERMMEVGLWWKEGKGQRRPPLIAVILASQLEAEEANLESLKTWAAVTEREEAAKLKEQQIEAANTDAVAASDKIEELQAAKVGRPCRASLYCRTWPFPRRYHLFGGG